MVVKRKFQVISPHMFGDNYNEMECLGSAVWLWINSKNHCQIPLYLLSNMLFPSIEKKQFVLIFEENKPVFFMNWALMNEQSEMKYLQFKTSAKLDPIDWNSGKRFWIIDWVAPFGHTRDVMFFLRDHVFSKTCGRYLYHRGNETGRKIYDFKGKNISKQEFGLWKSKYRLITD